MQPGITQVRTIIVDDSPTFLRTVCSFLDHLPSVEIVGTAGSASEALALIEQVRPELVLMDLQMPTMNGLEATAQLHQKYPDIKIIMVTGHDTPVLREASRESGAKGFISKSRFAQELPGILRNILDS